MYLRSNSSICLCLNQDLTAIGIKNPNHRKKLKVEIAQLNINDGLPDYIPVSLLNVAYKLISRMKLIY